MKLVLSIIGGWVLMIVTMKIPVGFSDAEIETVGRIVYYGLPIPHGVSPGYSVMQCWGRAMITLPFNVLFWTAALDYLLCRKLEKGRLKRMVVAGLIQVAIVAVLAFA